MNMRDVTEFTEFTMEFRYARPRTDYSFTFLDVEYSGQVNIPLLAGSRSNRDTVRKFATGLVPHGPLAGQRWIETDLFDDTRPDSTSVVAGKIMAEHILLMSNRVLALTHSWKFQQPMRFGPTHFQLNSEGMITDTWIGVGSKGTRIDPTWYTERAEWVKPTYEYLARNMLEDL